MTDDEAAAALYEALNPGPEEAFERLKGRGLTLAHYTSAENALNIINGRSIWLRNAALMNDFMEVGFGQKVLVEALRREGVRLADALEPHFPGAIAEIAKTLDDMHNVVRLHTFLTSLGVHDPEDNLGKLSMWRAYGSAAGGVAIVFNTDVFEVEENNLNASAYPVTYGLDEFLVTFGRTVDGLQQNQHLVTQLTRERVKRILYYILQEFVLTAKHPGFREEEEWRVIYSPALLDSKFITPKVVSIRGVPQIVQVVTLDDQPGLNMPELTLDRLIERIIIGPCEHPLQIGLALSAALTEAGVTNADERIVVSEIPLRQRG